MTATFAKRIKKVLLKFTGILALGLLILWVAFFFWIGGPKILARRHHFNHLVKTADHQALLAAAIPVITSTTNDVIYYRLHDRHPCITNLPAIMHDMEPNYISVCPEGLIMEFHGGFDHYGFEILKQDQWELSWYTEQGHHPILTTQIEGSANK